MTDPAKQKMDTAKMQFDNGYFENCDQQRLSVFLSAYIRIVNSSLPGKGESASTDYQLGKLYEDFGLFDFAVSSFEKYIRLNPGDAAGYASLANLYARHGLYYSGKNVVRAMCAAFPDQSDLQPKLRALEKAYPDREVSFYLPCYNVEGYVAECLRGIYSQSFKPIEILVIDDGSRDRSIEIARSFPVKVVSHPVNKGLAAARNTAIANAAGEFLASVDTDAVPDRFWLERLILSFDAEGTIAGVGGKLIEKNTVTAVDRWRQVILKQHHGDEALDNVLLFGSNTVFRLAALKQVGGYNEQFRTNFEDMDICNRLFNGGFRSRYNPSAVCRHLRVDNLISAANTLYNWRKPIFEINGAFDNLSELQRKGDADLAAGLQDLKNLLSHQYYETVYLGFLCPIRSLLKDISRSSMGDSEVAMRRVFAAALLCILHLLVDKVRDHENLIGRVMQDIEDIVRDALNIKTREQLSGCLMGMLQTVKEFNSLESALAAFDFEQNVYCKYLHSTLKKLNQILNLDSMLLAMTWTSARRIQHETDHSPYVPTASRVMLLNPPWQTASRRGVRAGSRWPYTSLRCDRKNYFEYKPYPFFLCYLSALLKEKNIPNVIADGIAEDLTNEEFLERVAGYGPAIVVMEISTASYLVDTLWLLKIRERLPQVKVVWVGPHASALADSIMAENLFVDYVVQGEYESTTANLIESLLKQQNCPTIKGVVYRTPDGRIQNNGPADLIADLDSLPWPERLTVPIYRYNDLFAGMQFPSLQIHGSRGCPFGCIYCVWPQVLYGGRTYRPRHPSALMEEVESMVREFGFRSVYFDDDTFNIGKKRIADISNEFLKRSLKIPWGAMARADTVDRETYRAMRNAGMVAIKFGVESGVQELVDRARKGLNLDNVKQAVSWCKELGIKTHLTFTFGLPGENQETIRQTIEYAKQLDPDTIQFSITTPFPGTRYFNMLKESGNLLSEEWDKFDGGRYTVIRTDALSAEDLEAALKTANSEYCRHKMKSLAA